MAGRMAGRYTASILPEPGEISDPACSAALAAHRPRPLIESQPAAEAPRQFISVSEKRQGRRFYISGRVQGVGYRFFACDAAERQGVTGYVRNLRDGRVEVYAVGTEAQLEAFVAELRRGPRMAAVEQVSQADAEPLAEFASRFSIDRD